MLEMNIKYGDNRSISRAQFQYAYSMYRKYRHNFKRFDLLRDFMSDDMIVAVSLVSYWKKRNG